MSAHASNAGTMRSIRFHSFGRPADVLHLDTAEIPVPGPGTVCVQVRACGLNPADWALCEGLFPGNLPRGIGLDVSGIVTSIGEGVTGARIGDPVLGAADYINYPSAGASDFAILQHWTAVPTGLNLVKAAALPLVTETAYRYLSFLGLKSGETVLIHGAGTMVGFAAVQIALLRGARVIATAGETYAERLRELGALVTGYGEGMVERVRGLIHAAPDRILDAAPVNLQSHNQGRSGLADLVKIAGDDPLRVITIADWEEAKTLGVRTGMEDVKNVKDIVLRWDVLSEFAHYAAEKHYTVPIANTFALEDWRKALDASVNGQARGKLVLLPRAEALE